MEEKTIYVYIFSAGRKTKESYQWYRRRNCQSGEMTYPKWKSWESTEGPQLWIQSLYLCTRMRKWDECSENISGSGQSHLRVGSGPTSIRAGVKVIHLLLKLEWLWLAGYRRLGAGCAQRNVPARGRPDNPGEHKWPGRQEEHFCADSFVHIGRISFYSQNP